MTPADIQRLRQQQMFGGDITSGGIMGGIMGDMGGYEQSDSPQPGMDEGLNIPMIRSREIIGPENQNVAAPAAPAAPPAPQVGGNNQQNLLDLVNNIYTPQTEARDRYGNLLDNAPVREGPGFGRALVAAGMGLNAKDPESAMKVMEGTMYAPHLRAMADWTAKTGPFGNAAQYENTANINERTLAGNLATNIVNQQRYDQQNAVAEEKNDVARIRNEAYAMKQMGWSFDFSGPNIIATSPDGRTMVLGPTGKMAEFDKINLQNKGRVEAAAAIGQNAATVAGVNQSQLFVDSKGQYYLLNPAQAADAATMGLRPISPGATPFPQGGMTPVPGARGTTSSGVNTPTEQRAERNQKFLEFADKRPDLAAKWLIQPLTATGNWGIKPPPIAKGLPFFKSIDPNEMNEYNMVREELGLPPMPSPQANTGLGPTTTPNISQGGTIPGLSAPGVGQQQSGQWQTVDPGGIDARPNYGPPPPPPPQGVPGNVGGQQRYMQPPMQLPDLSTPPSTRTGVGGVQQQVGAPTTPPPPGSPAAVAAEVESGARLTVTDPATGRVTGTIPNNPEAIAYWTNVKKMQVNQPAGTVPR